MYDFDARKVNCTLRVTDKAGNPVKNARVRAELKNHSFLFGTGAFFGVDYVKGTEPAYYSRVMKEWAETFNYGTLSFYLGRYEPEMGKTLEKDTLASAEYLSSQGKTLKGHPLVWHTVAANWMYDWDENKVLDYMLYRIEREMTAFKDTVGYWDVINEAVIMPEFVNEPASNPKMNPVTRLCRKMGRVPLIKLLFEKAKSVNPDAKLLINDFNTSARYSDLVKECLDAGAPIDIIGIQSHQHQGFWGMEKLAEVTERFEKLGLPIHYTENTFVSGHIMPPEIVDLNDYVVDSWPTTPEGEEYQKEMFMTMLGYLFSRPQVTGFTTWSFEDRGAWLGAPAGLIRKDASPKPALIELRNKLNNEWTTKHNLTTDENGVCAFGGFKGKYNIAGREIDINEGGEINIVL